MKLSTNESLVEPRPMRVEHTDSNLKYPLVRGGVVDGLISVVRRVGVSPHSEDVKVGVSDPAHLGQISYN